MVKARKAVPTKLTMMVNSVHDVVGHILKETRSDCAMMILDAVERKNQESMSDAQFVDIVQLEIRRMEKVNKTAIRAFETLRDTLCELSV
jgi:hypothetical protein